MILIDYREENKQKLAASQDLMRHIKNIKVPCETAQLPYGDAMFEGRGPDESTVAVGIERKKLHDMLNCIEDSRYAAHQLPGMKSMYSVSILLIEGHWKPHDPTGYMMEGFNGGLSWGYLAGRRRATQYAMLYRYLISVQLAGVIVTYSRDPWHTAYNICEWYHYFQKKWNQHHSLMEMQKLVLPTLSGRPSLTRKWAACLTDIGSKLSGDMQKVFKRPIDLAHASEDELLKVPGVGMKTAKSIVKEIWGRK